METTTEPDRPLRAAVYLRQSLDPARGTPEEGRAIERQRQDCLTLAEARGWQVAATYEDNDTSASTTRPRPGFERMLGHAEDGTIQVVIAWHADRLARKVTDLERLVEVSERTGLRVATVSGDLDLGTDAGRLVARILVSVARGETERKGARQRRANLQRAEAGLPRTNRTRSFGYDQDGITVREDEAALVKAAYAEVLAGGSLNRIATRWTREGVPTLQGGKAWGAQVVRQVLLNPRNAGFSAYKDEIVGRGTWPTLVEEETWEAVRVLLTDPSRRKTAAAPKRTRLLSGLMLCGKCGDGTTVKAAARSYDNTPTYVCRLGKHMSRLAEPIDREVRRSIIERPSRDDARKLVENHDGPNAAKLRSELHGLRARRDALAVEFAQGTIPVTALRAGTATLNASIEDLERRLVDQDRAILLPLIEGNAADIWDNDLDVHRRRAVIALLCTITAHPLGKGYPRTAPPITAENLVISWHQA